MNRNDSKITYDSRVVIYDRKAFIKLDIVPFKTHIVILLFNPMGLYAAIILLQTPSSSPKATTNFSGQIG